VKAWSSFAFCVPEKHRLQKYLIVTADDFGLHPAVNAGIERAAGGGVLTAASLMVGAAAAADAVNRASRLPKLRVGLHLVLADGQSILAPRLLRDLADSNGWMDHRMAGKAVRIFLLPRVRRQLEAEVRAQFEAFARTGLALDHVNVHKHFHVHPTILHIVLRVARDYGSPPIRLPAEPRWSGGAASALIRPWITLMGRRLRRAGVFHNDAVFGMADSGQMNEARLLEIIARLPAGVTEIYLHPAVESRQAIAPGMSAYRHTDELAALLSPRVRAAISACGAGHGGFTDCLKARAAL
jgi:chitin disaccharide deacetylase